jgi:hypothetical protein
MSAPIARPRTFYDRSTLDSYIAAAERVANERCDLCPHLRGDHRRHDSFYPYAEDGSRLMCSVDLCECGWPR